jgi:2-dehydro-3-deoxygalactonokinase
LALFERMPTQELASYLSGLLIGEELRTQSLHASGEVVLIGSPALTQRYTLALRATGIATRTLGAEATWAGLHALSVFLDADRTSS